MPFLAQKVVDQGYELPIPYGVGLTYVSSEQELPIDNLEVGFNGGDKTPSEFVDASNTITDIRSLQLKADAWILPFLNVFALLGQVDGEVTSDILLDGNTLLDQVGADCDRIIPPFECILFKDKNALLPIRTGVNVKSYGVGAILAGGWRDFFATIPAKVTYTLGRTSEFDGNSLTITPRVGRLFKLGGNGNLAVFIGGNYLDSDQQIDGVFEVPGVDLDINYLIDQKNKDPWNVVVGFNWDISRHFSWSLEYNGFTGTREAWITSVNILTW